MLCIAVNPTEADWGCAMELCQLCFANNATASCNCALYTHSPKQLSCRERSKIMASIDHKVVVELGAVLRLIVYRGDAWKNNVTGTWRKTRFVLPSWHRFFFNGRTPPAEVKKWDSYLAERTWRRTIGVPPFSIDQVSTNPQRRTELKATKLSSR